MTPIDTIGTRPAVQAAQTAPAPVINSDFETFLKMLTTQLKNQDPLNPIESSDFAVQLATFSSVEQQVMTNDLLSGLSGQMGQMGMAQLATWVGMEARAPMPAPFDGFPVSVYPTVSPTADAARIVIRNAQGSVVESLPLSLDQQMFEWTGRDAAGQFFPSGLYGFEVENYNNGDLTSTTTAEVYHRIEEARLDAGRTILVMEGGASIDAAQVKALRN
ncbi:MAG: flagellar hook assembly protein FlgD [Paracoccaceae bacterium]|jgi:flagellar basal-body rod modification protein FlgD|nr:flagellar hook assembly protein FlgD [Paracoccaceae bacterium]